MKTLLCKLIIGINVFQTVQSYEQLMRAADAQDVIQRIKHLLPVNPVILEAGAFNGYDTLRLKRLIPGATIHSFEPVPELFGQLATATKPYNTIHVYDYALGKTNGLSLMYISQRKSNPDTVYQANSLLPPEELVAYAPYITFNKAIQVKTITIDEWAHTHNVSHIDFMWLDLQGYELPVLQGAVALLPTVKALLVEVSFVKAYENQDLFDEVLAWLQQEGFELKVLYHQKWFGDALFVRE